MSDTKEIINCPACGKEMKKVFVDSANCNIDICVDGCGGIYFDNREFKKFDEKHENIDEIVNAYQNKTYDKVNESDKRICPVCGATMIKHFASAKKEVEIDECYNCGGIFLDYGEIDKIRAQYDTENQRSNDFMEYFEDICNISDFKDYKAKNVDEILSKRKINLSKQANFLKELF